MIYREKNSSLKSKISNFDNDYYVDRGTFMKLYLDLDGKKGMVGTAHDFNYAKLVKDAQILLDKHELTEEHLTLVMAGVLTKDITHILRGLLETYKTGPPREDEAKVLHTKGGSPLGVVIGLDGKPITKH